MQGPPIASPPRLLQRRLRDPNSWQGERFIHPDTGKVEEICCEWPACLKSLEDPETGVFAGIKMYGISFCGRDHGDKYFHFYKIEECTGPLKHFDETSAQTIRMRREGGIVPGEVRDLMEEMQMGCKRRAVHRDADGDADGPAPPCPSPSGYMEEEGEDSC